MSVSNLKLRLLNRLRKRGKPAAAVGIDLGTTKSCLAYAKYDPTANALDCQCVQFTHSDGTRSVAFPSAIAQNGHDRLFGSDALALRKTMGAGAAPRLFYETKNLIGLRYTFKDAPAGLHNPTDVAAALVGHMRELARDEIPSPVRAPIVVTVPASFHATQREATIEAAERAFKRKRGTHAVRLLDEPCAAFADLKFREPGTANALLREGANILVFDFGGGTCDVAVFRIDSIHGGTLGARLLANSRYHRLGGGDVDRAIVHDVLIPQLLAQHDINQWNVSWDTRKHSLEPQLLDVAEQLKIALNAQLTDYREAGLDTPADRTATTVDMKVECDGQLLAFQAPTLTVEAFDRLLVRFLDPEPLPEAGDEYVERESIFAPIRQALLRARLERPDIHGVLLTGSSSLLVPVQAAMLKFLPTAKQVLLGTPEDLQAAVARGAAIQALSLQVLGKAVVEPVCTSAISLRLAEGEVSITRAGDAVPCHSRTPVLLRPPRDSATDAVEIAVEVLSDGKCSAGISLWCLPAPVHANERIELEWRMDENQCVELRLRRPGDERTEVFSKRFDAPIMHRDQSHLIRCRMLEREERFRTDAIPYERLGTAYEDHARDCAGLGEYGKALHYVSLALQQRGRSATLLNLRGLWCDRLGNEAGARDSYEAAGECAATKFNLALLHLHARRYDDALQCVEHAIALDPDERGYQALRGDVLADLGRFDDARAAWRDATEGHLDLGRMRDFTLSWLETAASHLGDETLRQRIQQQRHQLVVTEPVLERQGELPARYRARARAMP